MNSSRFKKNDIDNLYKFLLQHESICVSLIQNLGDQNHTAYCFYDTKNIIHGIISISKGGSILHCLPELDSIQDSKNYFFEILSQNKLFSITGEQKGTSLLLDWIKEYNSKVPYQINNYRLMERMDDFAPMAINGTECHTDFQNCIFRQCTQDDLKNLIPLEIGFQKEEVVTDRQKIFPAVYSYTLSQEIKNKVLFAAIKDNKFIAKAGVSASSWNYAQIGGVYTLPEYRRQGYSFATMNKLLSSLQKNNKKVVLFVNIENYKAIEMYKKLGFSDIGSYQVAYF